MSRVTLGNLGRSLSAEKRGETVLRVTLEDHDSSPSAEKHVCIVLAIEAPVGPNTQDRAEHLTAATGHLFEDVMATDHLPGIAGGVAETSPNTQCAF